METGIYNTKKPHIPLSYDKMLNNNIITNDPYKHQTPLGAGTLQWANSKITLQPAAADMNYDKM